MDLLHNYTQEKKYKKSNSSSLCELKLSRENDELFFSSYFEFNFYRYGVKKHLILSHSFFLNLIDGDIKVTYKILTNVGSENNTTPKPTIKNKRNDFKLLFDLVENGFLKGEKRNGYWGVKYSRNVDTMTRLVSDILRPKFNNDFLRNKPSIEKPVTISLFDLLVNFHLDKKKIKGHDNVYFDIQNDYPKKKWLLKNDNKFLPSVLDYYGIKSKYFISELNGSEKQINIPSLNYLCKLFGKNYIDYIKKIDWGVHCFEKPPNKKIHTLKNESEKSCLVKLINKWDNEGVRTETIIYSLNKLLTLRETLENKNIPVKFNCITPIQFDNLTETLLGIKLHLSRGYKVRYDFDSDFIDDVEKEIIINDSVFKPKVLTTEEEYRVEGFLMKNCMGKQFVHGSIYIYISLRHKRKRINIQYRKGEIVQSYGKANTATPELFNDAINILNKRLQKYPNVRWTKQKYDYINNNLIFS